MKYLLFETITVNVTTVFGMHGPDIKKDFFILEVSDDVKIIKKDRYDTVTILCSDYDINQDLPATGKLQYENKITITSYINKNMNIMTSNYFIDIFDTREEAELYYNLEE